MLTNSKELYLSILDQTILRVYVRHLLIFPFPDPSHADTATDALQAGFAAVLHQIPFLAGTIEQLDPQSGRLALRYYEHIPLELVSRIFSKNSHLSTNLNFDYEVLRKEGAPPLRLPSDVFCPNLLKRHPGLDDPFAEGITSFTKGRPIPVFAAQANFIPGGLILSVYAHHSVLDGTGILRLYQIWSEHVSSRSRGKEKSESLLSSPLSATSMQNIDMERRALDALASPSSSIRCPEVRYPGTLTNAPTLRNIPYKLTPKILIFPASTISDLSTSLSSISNVRISTFTALAALLWGHITSARSSSLAENGIRETTLGIAVDHRRNLGPPFTQSYLGNCTTGMITSLPTCTLISPQPITAEHLAPVALNISQSISSVNFDWFRARLSYYSRTPNLATHSLNLNLTNGPDLFITSWMHMGADCEWGIPGTMKNDGEVSSRCGKPTAIRKPHCASEGGIIILPRRKVEADEFEVLVCLEEVEMERVIESLLKGIWLKRVIDA